VSAGNELHPHCRGCGSYDLSENSIEHLPPQIAVTITRDTGKMMDPNAVISESSQNSFEIFLDLSINSRKNLD
jgi:hypothetical protein